MRRRCTPVTTRSSTSRCEALEIERLVQQPRNGSTARLPQRWRRFIVGGGAGWVARGAVAAPSVFQSFTVDALDAHRLYVVEVRHPVEVPGSERTHLQQWLTKRCGWTSARLSSGPRD